MSFCVGIVCELNHVLRLDKYLILCFEGLFICYPLYCVQESTSVRVMADEPGDLLVMGCVYTIIVSTVFTKFLPLVATVRILFCSILRAQL